MSLEADIFNALKGLVANRCYPDVAQAGAARPYIVWQQVGGAAFNFVDGSAPSKRQARIQVACWADSRLSANDLARSAESALISSLKGYVMGALVADYDEETRLYGARQDFTFTY
jgi:hypothetical protein